MKTPVSYLNGKIKWIIVIFLISIASSYAQTKIVAHKSHSGSKKTFLKAYKNNLFDSNRSNCGLPGNTNLILLDSVIALNDSVTILKMRESIVCYRFGTSYKDLKKSDFKPKTIKLINDKIFNRKNSVSFIKSSNNVNAVKFNNSIDEVVFVGFKKR